TPEQTGRPPKRGRRLFLQSRCDHVMSPKDEVNRSVTLATDKVAGQPNFVVDRGLVESNPEACANAQRWRKKKGFKMQKAHQRCALQSFARLV
ncbi:MAG: hypothetical protein U1D06_16335, partial [Paracoccaceae bacterium]|nr:hypothetical protein [Paracoccaceae bacterium]